MLALNGAESISMDMLISYLKKHVATRVTEHLFMEKDIALTRVFLVKYLLPTPLEVQ